MRKTVVSILSIIAAVLLMQAAAVDVQAQGVRIGFVQDEQIKMQYKAWQRAQEEWELEARAWEDEATAKQQELTDLQNDYERQKLILSDEKKREKEAAINAKMEALDAYTRQIYGPNGTAEKKQQSLLQPLLEKITKAIEDVAVENDYDVIFTLQSGLGYIKPTYDVTEMVLQKLEEIE
ncbi:MAG TPA: OmpH family outer membrane protein [candidate division Zixibacteria bacterium]|nr:OmpH family outer membrane protein [candidate division Zixibacteria bacterium]